ncbi:NAD-dependent epimerase/dehydratase family protein [Chitinophaga sp. 212800010-3]|uniref:polysaccharide biosynthesis C-terminal domain-containing protein n=1 Tax=unclassified Chitinophaga TaxID=2619133 RepID=UPI002DE81BDC|nr:glucose-6-phosphate isomerase [Chitinophaga sp. 212800010-3]
MKRIGITGKNGFIGTCLYNKISLLKDEFELVPFERSFWGSTVLTDWVKQCDIIVHLAAINRHPDSMIIHDTNLLLVQQLIHALDDCRHCPHILFSSSIQEEQDNLYGRSKRTGRELLRVWSDKHQAPFTGMIIPNVFGPFGRPFYNSVVATFCHQLCNNEEPQIDKDAFLQLVYVEELADLMIDVIRKNISISNLNVQTTGDYYVSEVLKKLQVYRELYFKQGFFPSLPDKFSVHLFNTFRSYIDHKSYFPFRLKQHTDNRGAFVEMIKLQQGGQVSFSTTHKGITRGNHFHTRKIERFLVMKGRALIQLRKYNTDEVLSFELDGETPSYVDMPVWYTHSIKNIGEDDLYTVFWINEHFDPKDPDTYPEIV